MKSLKLVLLSLVLAPGFSLARSQDPAKPIIPAPPPPAPAIVPPPAPVLIAAPAPGQVVDPAATTAANPAAVVKPAAGVTSDYVIGPQDQLMVSVFKEPTLSGAVVVRPDGIISLPLLNDVKAVDLTPAQLTEDLTTRFKKFLSDPVLTVTVMAVNSKFIFFAGETRIGKIPYNPAITPLQAIIENGGPTAYANQRKIYILRNVKGKQTKIPFNYKMAVKTGDQQGVTLIPGDTIVVP